MASPDFEPKGIFTPVSHRKQTAAEQLEALNTFRNNRGNVEPLWEDTTISPEIAHQYDILPSSNAVKMAGRIHRSRRTPMNKYVDTKSVNTKKS